MRSTRKPPSVKERNERKSFGIEPLYVEFVPGNDTEQQISNAIDVLKKEQLKEIRQRAKLRGFIYETIEDFLNFIETKCRTEIKGNHHSITGPDRIGITVFYDTIDILKTDKIIRVTLGDSGAINVPHSRLYIPHRKIEVNL